jgi:hypothetical protein
MRQAEISEAGLAQLFASGTHYCFLEALALFGTAHSKKNISETMFSLNFSMYGTEQMEGRCKPITTLVNGNPLPGKLFYRRNGQSYPVQQMTQTHKQLNRRVEIIVSDASGKIAQR